MKKIIMRSISIMLSFISIFGLAFQNIISANAIARNLTVYDISPIIVKEEVMLVCSNLNAVNLVSDEPTKNDEESEIIYSTLDIDNLSLVQPIENNEKAAFDISDEDIELIALVTMAEAGGEGEEGQRLVIDTILNRVDSEHFPNTIQGVIYQKNAFTPVENGKIEKYWVSDEIVELIKEELISRTNYECVFFRAGKYSKYGVPLFNVNNQYFSKYE